MKALLRLLLLVPFVAAAQGKGIQFVHAANWQEVLRQARTENKLIFVDAYTTWCGPCRFLASEIFPQEEVGRFYNERFISVKLQLDSTAQDNEYVRGWYPDAGRMMRDMKINVFPTLLYFDSDGTPIHRVAGAGDAQRILGNARTALDSNTRYYTLLARYQGGARDEPTLRAFVRSSLLIADMAMARKAFSDWLRTDHGPLTQETAQMVEALVESVDDEAFQLMTADTASFNRVFGQPGAAQSRIRDALYNEFKNAAARTKMSADYGTFTNNMRQRFGAEVDVLAAWGAMDYYRSTGNWEAFGPAAVNYMKLAQNPSPMQQNDIAWAFFEHYSDPRLLNQALAWSKASIATNEPNFIDTYANLLHKLGRTREAISWEEKAMAMVPEDQKASYRTNIDKMKKGQKTW